MNSYIKNYPRPQLVRPAWTDLNGTWKFQFDDHDKGETERWYETFPEKTLQIEVPFTYETKCSGVEDTAHHAQVWYSRSVELTEEKRKGKKTLIHFEGSDFLTKLWVNGTYVGCHRGGYARFTFDITRYLHTGANDLTVKVEDSCSIEQPRGKQRWVPENFGCWYVQTTGIWKTVWLEAVPETYLKGMKLTPDLSNNTIRAEYETSALEEGNWEIETEIWFGEQKINRSVKPVHRDRVLDVISVYRPDLEPWGVYHWMPGAPNLYDMTVRILKDGIVVDEAASYFGMRDIRIEAGNILLNGRPLYQRLILDQGYWENSNLTPPDEETLIDDIDKIQSMGYNGVRKHMKIEDERFLYWCDKKGLLVWSEMAATYEFSDQAVQEFTTEWMEIVRQNYSHPSIITWTPFNESWGVPKIKTDKQQQKFTEAIYYLTKSMDAMRPVIVNDGWEHTVSDIITLHDYEEAGEVFFNRYNGNLEKMMKFLKFIIARTNHQWLRATNTRDSRSSSASLAVSRSPAAERMTGATATPYRRRKNSWIVSTGSRPRSRSCRTWWATATRRYLMYSRRSTDCSMRTMHTSFRQTGLKKSTAERSESGGSGTENTFITTRKSNRKKYDCFYAYF